MKILIAGATGLIGKSLVARCMEEGILVNYLTTRKEKIKTEPNIQGYYWNPSKGIIDEKALDGVISVVNLAGASVSKRWTASYKRTILKSRTEPAQLLLKVLKERINTVTQYISASGISIYPSSLDELYTEKNTKIASSFLGKIVQVWEASADTFSTIGIKVSKVRTGIVLSTEGGALPQMVKPIKMGVGAPLGNGEQWQSWIHINDIVGIYMHLLKNDLSGVFNAVSPNPVTNKRLTHMIADILDKNLWMPNVPAFLLRLVLGKRASLALESQLVSAEKIQESGYNFEYVNPENALSDLL